MRRFPIEADLRKSAQVHARLLDEFIALTSAELDRHSPGFVEESLHELLDTLRSERRTYGTLGAAAPVAALEDAA